MSDRRASEAATGDLSGVEAVVFDVDGTLYVQRPLRLFMVAELLVHGLRHGRLIGPDVPILRAFRKDRERLRDGRPPGESLAQAELGVVARQLGVTPERVGEVVDEWMHRRPLRYLARVRRRGLRRGLEKLRAAGLRLGVFSDHAIGGKLDALGIADLIDGAWGATDAEIDAFKPDPTGFLHCCTSFGLPPERVAYVGDRADVDAAGARAAGMPCVLIGGGAAEAGVPHVRNVPELVRVLLDARATSA